MLKVKAVVTSVELSNINGVMNIKLFVNAYFDGFVRHIDTLTGAISFEKGKVNYVKFTMAQFVHFVNEVAPLHSYYLNGINPYEISQADARDLLVGGTIVFTNQLQEADSEYQLPDGTIATRKGDRYDNQLKSIEPCLLNKSLILGMEKTPEAIIAAMSAGKSIAAEVTEVTETAE